MSTLLSDPSGFEPSTEPQEPADQGPGAEPQDEPALELPQQPQTTEATLSRSQKARARREEWQTKLSELEQGFRSQQEQYSQELSKRDAELARLRGTLEALQPLVAQRQAPTQTEVPLDQRFDQLRAEAQRAIDNNDFATYNAKLMEAGAIKAEMQLLAKYPHLAKAPQQVQQEPAMNPHTVVMLARYPEAGRNLKLVDAWASMLLAKGGSPGPDLVEQAFKMAQNELTAQNKLAQGPRFGTDKRSQELLTGSSGGGGGTPRSKGSGDQRIKGLPSNWKQIAALADMPEDAYLKQWAQAHPESVEES